MIDAMQSTIIALISAIVVTIINHYFVGSQKRNESERNLKLKSYSSFLDNARAFLDDPNLSKDERRKLKRLFLEKYYNEIILFANKEIQEKIESFVNTGGVAATNSGD